MQKYATIAALMLIGIAFAILAFTRMDQPATEPTSQRNVPKNEPVLEKRKIVRDVTPREFVQAPVLEDEILERLPAKEVPVQKRKAKPKQWRLPNVLQAGVLSSNGETLNLEGIKPLPVDHVCTDEAGTDWPCGRFGRTAFRNMVRGRTISCAKETETESGLLARECKIGNTDLSRWLVVTGWAEPKPGRFDEEFKRAKSEQRGLWRRYAP